MAIVRVNHTENYTVMSNVHLNDKRLTLKAKGLLTQILSLPDDWDYTVAGLVAINCESKSAIETALKELKDAGYIVIKKLFPNQTTSGRIEYIYDVFENPEEAKQEGKKQGVEIQGLEFQGVENQTQLNIYKQSTKEQSTNNKKGVFENFAGDDEKLLETLKEFTEMRKKSKKPLTDKAKELIINKLSGYPRSEWITMLEQSIENSWASVYPLKKKSDSVYSNEASYDLGKYADLGLKVGAKK